MSRFAVVLAGDRTVRVRLQSDLEVSGDGSVAKSSGEHIVTRDSSRRSTGQPVFRSESSGTLMTLPGGVLGFPSLNVANTLAAQDGVLISSPNWWREHTRARDSLRR